MGWQQEGFCSGRVFPLSTSKGFLMLFIIPGSAQAAPFPPPLIAGPDENEWLWSGLCGAPPLAIPNETWQDSVGPPG